MTEKGPLDILIIDDDEFDREAIKRALGRTQEPRGFSIAEADTGTQGLDLLRARKFSCVFLDYRLPDMDGLRVLHELFDARTGLVSSPVVFLTAQGNESVMLEALRYGAQDYLVKDNLSDGALNIALKKSRELFDLKAGRRQAEEQLQHMRKMDAVGQLTSGIAHDFNNLLTVVLGNLHLLRERLEAKPEAIDPEYLRKKIDMMETVARGGADLVRRLMVFTRQRPLQQEICDLNLCIADTLEFLRRPLGETVDIVVNRGENLFPVLIDPVEFSNVLINMAVNARDAMPHGGTLTISTENQIVVRGSAEEIPAGAYVRVTIADTGAGMSPETVLRVFEPFFTTKAAGEGTGLGLSMAYGFVKQSGGHIHVDSSLSEGTVFRIYLPKAEAVPPAPEDNP